MPRHTARAFALASALLVLGPALPAAAEVVRIEVLRRHVIPESSSGETDASQRLQRIPPASFGEVGAYERIIARFHGELDPEHPLNRGIVDLAAAPRNARGRVEYSADLDILKPLDPKRGNGVLLYDVNNRGNKRALADFNDAPRLNDPTTLAHLGNGFLMRRGYTVVWSGWINDIPGAKSGELQIRVPSAPGLEQAVWDELLPNGDGTLRFPLTFRAARTDRGAATLYRRTRHGDAPRPVPEREWEFAGDRAIRLLPAGRAFERGVLYQVVYPAANPPVSGIGFAATRDLIAFLRHARVEANPLAGAIHHTLAYGASQSGRYLRDFTWRGFNEDEQGRRVFDAINPHISTARLFLNHRFAQPIRMTHIGYGFHAFPDIGFPFAYQDETDPYSGAVDGILKRCRERGNCPKVVHTTTGTEYWQSGQSLVTTDPAGRRDAVLPEGVRIYHYAGTQHIMGATMPPGICALPPNTVDPRPAMRAVLVAMERWVREDAPPPPSAYPRLSDGSLVAMRQWRFPDIPGVQRPHAPAPKTRFDYGPDFAQGVFSRALPAPLEGDYPVRVPQVDGDGNEIGGIRLPEQAVPLATSMGWAVRGAASGTQGELCYLDGSIVPLLRNPTTRRESRDPRPSLAERYGDPATYAARVAEHARALERAGLLLDEDVQRIVRRAEAVRW